MEIYSEEQLKRILNSSPKTIILEVMDMNNEMQNNLHFEINDLILKEYNSKLTLLKINKNFYNNLFNTIKKYPTFIVFEGNKEIKSNSEIENVSDFKTFINSLF